MSWKDKKAWLIEYFNSVLEFEDKTNELYKQGYWLHSWRTDSTDTGTSYVAVFCIDPRAKH